MGDQSCALYKISLLCTFIVGFKLVRFLIRFLYNNFLGPALQINSVTLKDTGKWAVPSWVETMEDKGCCGFFGKVSLICTAFVFYQIVRFLYKNLVAVYLKIDEVNLKEHGKWAVVTGATDGIGKAYAEHLAKLGMNIVLISRTQAKLEDVAQDIEKKYNVETKIIAVNFTYTENIYHEIDKQLTGLNIGVLVNNVGMSYAYPEYFLDIKNNEELVTNIINCNIFSVTRMCKIVMPGMVERRKGVVINIASTAAQIPNPLLTVYAASKAYVVKFSEDLSAEYSKQGIIVQCLVPGYVATNMSKIRSSTWMAPSPKKYVGEAIKTIGVSETTTGYFPHTLLIAVVHFLESISPKLSRWIISRTMTNIRARALRRTKY